ncbi:hypothetical protein CHS0354_030671 [Potamilus streckersoni]|uniref:Homeobox domain-containing protein n=1 Tax=Potamilus streckersoni TaxID=2493646 RepID=A0AAE0SU65_9BIVA|nr:hypothetical protein CHS0354_030671 [Potamilus streckersoni]
MWKLSPINGNFELVSTVDMAPVEFIVLKQKGGPVPFSSASDQLQQAMDFSMIMSPPRSPYGYYGMFSPVTPSLSPANTPGYLNKLRSNPMFQDLQMLLAQECYGVQVPANLITTGWNLMHLPSIDASASTIIGSKNVYLRHMQFQDKLLKVRIDPHVSAYGLKVENEYSIKVGEIEMGRYQDLLANMGNTVLKTAVNSYYDKERIILVQKAEADLDKLIAKAEDIRKSVTKANVMEKESSQGRPPKRNVMKRHSAVRQLSFGNMDDSGERDSFDSGFKSDVEDIDIDMEAISGNNKNINKNCVSQSVKQKSTSDILYEDEKHAKNKCSIQPDSTINLSPVSDKSFLINCDNFKTPNQQRSQASFNLSCSQPKNSFNGTISCTPEQGNSLCVELSPLNDPSDFLLRIAHGSSGKSKDNHSKSQLQAESQIVCSHNSESQASSSSQQKSFLDRPIDITTGMDPNGMDRTKGTINLSLTSHHPCLKTHKVLSNDAANILSMWYEVHLQYPYPTEEEVKELSDLTGVTGKQVKKWMANKRIRCFNTLSITGNKHPIKFKYDGRVQKRKHSEVEKDDSSSFEPNSNSLSEESRRILNNWFDSHRDNPYPLEEEKKELALQCGITLDQVKSWFANKRSRTNKTRKQVPNYFIKKFPQYVPIVEAIGQQREKARLAKKCRLNNDFTNTVPFL